jgi:hypothetical protein
LTASTPSETDWKVSAMSDMPQYPAGQPTSPPAADAGELAPRSRRTVYVAAALVVLLVVVFVVLHLSGVLGPGEH